METKLKSHKTSPKGTGDANRKVVELDLQLTTPPLKPSTLSHNKLYKDPVYASEFYGSNWKKGEVFGEGKRGKTYHAIILDPHWKKDHIVDIKTEDFPLKPNKEFSLKFHRLIADQFLAWFRACAVRGTSQRIRRCVGTFVPRTIDGSPSVLSNHSYGLAIDLNSVSYDEKTSWNPQNNKTLPFGVARGVEGSVWELADICGDFGIFWGGWFNYRDPMHFEAVKVLSTSELDAACSQYGFSYNDLVLGTNRPPGFNSVPRKPPNSSGTRT